MTETLRIKTISCLLRQPEKFNLSLGDALARNETPRAGDLVFLRCLSSDGAVTHLENHHGMFARLCKGDAFVGVLADRKSGWDISAEMPKGPIAKGDVLGLIHRNGLAGIPVCIPSYVGSRIRQVEVLGFVRGRKGPIANVADAPPIDVSKWGATPQSGRMLFIIGTSSECGKTTFMTNFNLAIKRQRPGLKTAAVKACGTGSNRDKQAMLDANYDAAVDFVDLGLVTTYELAPQRYGDVFRAMLNVSQAKSDVVVTEIGGDFLEASAPEALRILGGLQASCVLQVNDAMGAMEGIRRLAQHGIRPIAICCFRQNLASLRARLAAEGHGDFKVMDNRDETAMDELAGTFVESVFGGDQAADDTPIEHILWAA